MTDPPFVEALTRLETIDQKLRSPNRTPADDAERTRIDEELDLNLARLEARWLDDVDGDMATVLRTDRAEHRRRCADGGVSLLGDYLSEANIDRSSR